MNKFDLWLSRRRNEVNEGMFDWLWGNQQATTPTAQSWQAPPAHGQGGVESEIYSGPVQQYVQRVLKHLKIEVGQTLQKVDGRGMPSTGPIHVVDRHTTGPTVSWQDDYPVFWEALHRYVAGHLFGNSGGSKSYLNISHHDAAVILKTLDSFKWYDSTNLNDSGSIADDWHITDLDSLQSRIQTWVPTAPDATLQYGYGKGNQEYGNIRNMSGKGNPILIPVVRNLAASGEEVIKQYDDKTRGQSKRLWKALNDLAQRLAAVTGRSYNVNKRTKATTPPSGPSGPPPPGGVPSS